MDYVLLDIKNFLKKLESGQLEIEAGQWELHKDITNVKKAVEELKELKNDFEKMRLSSVQQLGLIKSLQQKIDDFKKERESSESKRDSENNEQYKQGHRKTPEEQSKSHKKRKCHVVRSEEVIEITSRVSQPSVSEQISKTDTKDSEETFDTTDHNDSREFVRNISSEPKSQKSRSPKNEILQRYLKDSAKYKDKKPSQESDLSCRKENISNQDTGNTPFWDEYRAPTNVKPKPNFSKSGKTSESVIPRRLACPRCPKKFTYKVDFLKHEREHRRAKAKFFCHVCGKGFYEKSRLKMHSWVHKATDRASKGYTCSYCDKVCSTPDKLTAHLRECRTIRRSRFRRSKI